MEIKQLHANAGNYGPARNARAIKYIVIHYRKTGAADAGCVRG